MAELRQLPAVQESKALEYIKKCVDASTRRILQLRSADSTKAYFKPVNAYLAGPFDSEESDMQRVKQAENGAMEARASTWYRASVGQGRGSVPFRGGSRNH